MGKGSDIVPRKVWKAAKRLVEFDPTLKPHLAKIIASPTCIPEKNPRVIVGGQEYTTLASYILLCCLCHEGESVTVFYTYGKHDEEYVCITDCSVAWDLKGTESMDIDFDWLQSSFVKDLEGIRQKLWDNCLDWLDESYKVDRDAIPDWRPFFPTFSEIYDKYHNEMH